MVVQPSDMIAFGDSEIGMWGLLSDHMLNGPSSMAAFGGSGFTSWGAEDTWYPLGQLASKGGQDAQDAQCWAATQRRHGGRFNVGFCDAHVENLRVQDLFDLRKTQQIKRWSPDDLPHPELVLPGLLP
jgi:prepilin-type processing-associated H-X9-DG protein